MDTDSLLGTAVGLVGLGIGISLVDKAMGGKLFEDLKVRKEKTPKQKKSEDSFW